MLKYSLGSIPYALVSKEILKYSLGSIPYALDSKEMLKYSLGSIPYALGDHMGVMMKTKISDLLVEHEKDTVLVSQIPKSSCSIIDAMAIVDEMKDEML